MAWISVHESVDGPKLRSLYKKLKCSKFEAIGILNFLWFWGLNNADKDGLILYADREDIERYLYGVGAGCGIPAKEIVDALFNCGWLDWTPLGINIHDWSMWQDQWYKAKEARERDAERKRASRRNNKPPEPEKHEEPDGTADSSEGAPQDVADGGGGAQSDGKPPGETPEKPKEEKYTPDFDVFWGVYPRKEEKGNAYKKYMARIKEGYSPAELLEAAKNYAAQCKRLGTEKRYIKHPKTFLSDSRPFLDFLPKNPQTEPSAPVGTNPFAEYGEGGPDEPV